MTAVAVGAVTLWILCIMCPVLGQTNHSGSFFNCPPLERSDATPTSVNRLRPSDIAVIGAMGNSLTAGFAVLFELQDYNPNRNDADFRGLAWSAGTHNNAN